MRKRYGYVISIGILVCVAATTAMLWRHSFSSPPAKRAFYYWKTQWSASPEILKSLENNHIRRLYMPFQAAAGKVFRDA
jgi:hypothetical protein